MMEGAVAGDSLDAAEQAATRERAALRENGGGASGGFRIPRAKSTFLMLLSTILNLTAAIIASQGEDHQICGDKPYIPERACLTPYSFFVIWMTIAILLAMVNDIEADIVLMLATMFLMVLPGPCKYPQTGEDAYCTIITLPQALQGFSSPPILATAVLFVFARCLEETRAVELLITPCLKGASNEVSAVMRLAFPTFFFSSFLNSTPIVAMLIPVCESWCARTGFKLTTVLMPLSFSAMLGGLTSLVGTASNMVLNAQIEIDPEPPIEPFEFFTQAPAGVPAAICGLTVMSFLAPILLGRLGQPSEMAVEGDNGVPALTHVGSSRGNMDSNGVFSSMSGPPTAADEHVGRGFEIEVMVRAQCELIGQTIKQFVETVLKHGDVSPEVRGGVVPLKVCWLIRRDGTRTEASASGFRSLTLAEGDRLGLSCAAVVVPPLRALAGVRAAPEEASEALSGLAKRRCLFEAALSKFSPLVGLDKASAAGHEALQYTVLWAVRTSPLEMGMSLSLGSTKRPMSGKVRDRFTDADPTGELQIGDTLLIEADEDFAEAHKNDKSYALVTVVRGSLPPASSSETKPPWLVSAQFYASILALVVMAVVSIFFADYVPILQLAFLLMFFLVGIGCITPDQAWRSIKYRVVITIMSAFGLGAALDNTDVADIIAFCLVHAGGATGPWVFLVIIFCITAGLSFLVGSTPAIILLYASVRLTGEDPNLPDIGQSMMALMLGAVCALATPVGFATNLMVQARAGYFFGDFFLLGSVVTLTVCLVSCSIILVLPPEMYPQPPGANASGVLGAGGVNYQRRYYEDGLGPYRPYYYQPSSFDPHAANFEL